MVQLPVQSVPITTKVVSSNPVHGEVHLIQHYMIKFVSNLQSLLTTLFLLKCLQEVLLFLQIQMVLYTAEIQYVKHIIKIKNKKYILSKNCWKRGKIDTPIVNKHKHDCSIF
jgi:hypothetical protein